jgi:hypothetical protein
MSDQTQRVTEERLNADPDHIDMVRHHVKISEALGPFWKGMLLGALATIDDLRASAALAQSQAATIAELRAEVEREKAETARILEIGKRFERDYHNTFEQSCKNLRRAEAAESALATATARIEKKDEALRGQQQQRATTAEYVNGLIERLTEANLWDEMDKAEAAQWSHAEQKVDAALSEDKPHG